MMPVITINDVPLACLEHASSAYHVSMPLILSIMKKENGRNGQAIKNKTNGTYDLGVFQINSRWLPTLKHYGYTQHDLQNNPCKNTMAGVWILAKKLAEDKPLWSAVGGYHSYTPKYNARYRYDIQNHYQKIVAALNT